MSGADSRGLALLANPSAGGGRSSDVVREVERHLTARGAACRTVATRDVAHTVEAAREAVDRGDVAVAVGGDGMLRIVADAVVGRAGATIGAIAAGRGNDFARFVGLPTEPAAAADALVDGVAVPIDCGRGTGDDGTSHAYLSIASCGFDSEANRIANDAPSRLGRLVYVYGLFGALLGLRPIPYRLTIDGATRDHRGVTVAVANAGAYGGGMHLAPDASIVDGRFDVVLIGHGGRRPDRSGWADRARLVRFLPRLFKGTHVATDVVDVRRASEIRVEADGPLAVFADGDQIGTLPMTFSVVAGGLSLVVPPQHPLAAAGARATVAS